MLRFALVVASLCTLIMFSTISAKMASGRYAQRAHGLPFCVGPDGCALSVPAWPVIVCVSTIIDDTHWDALDHFTCVQKTTVGILEEQGDIKIFGEV